MYQNPEPNNDAYLFEGKMEDLKFNDGEITAVKK